MKNKLVIIGQALLFLALFIVVGVMHLTQSLGWMLIAVAILAFLFISICFFAPLLAIRIWHHYQKNPEKTKELKQEIREFLGV